MLRALDPQDATPLACRVHRIEADLTRTASDDRLRIAIPSAAVARRLRSIGHRGRVSCRCAAVTGRSGGVLGRADVLSGRSRALRVP